MQITELKLINFRNYQDLVLYPDPQVNLFFGNNGSGKTNLLEAIHYACLGRSHRVSNDSNVVRNGERFASASVQVSTALGQRNILIRFHPGEAQKKEIYIDGKKIQKFSDMMGCLRCVIFSPEDLGLIREGPSVRRRYLDMMISQISRRYFISLQKYRSGLEQRNAILRNLKTNVYADRTILGAFEEAMAEPAGEIIRERRRIADMLSEIACDQYRRISGTEEQFQIVYHSSLKDKDSIEDAFCRALEENREDDIRLGMTSVGPHRDDLNLTLDRNPMKQFSSQGQVRTAALSMKLSQMQILRDDGGDEPVLLLDDVMSELDRNRRASLIQETGRYQTFITCADLEDVERDRIHMLWHVFSKEGIGSLKKSDQ